VTQTVTCTIDPTVGAGVTQQCTTG
jgi:hypothetical protein